MKLFLKLLTLVLVIGCVMLAAGCKKDIDAPVDLPDESITENNGSIVEDEITADELLGIESDKNTSSDPIKDNSNANTSSDTNSDSTSSTTSESNSSSSTSSGSNSSSSTSSGGSTDLPSGNESDNKGYVSGWY